MILILLCVWMFFYLWRRICFYYFLYLCGDLGKEEVPNSLFEEKLTTGILSDSVYFSSAWLAIPLTLHFFCLYFELISSSDGIFFLILVPCVAFFCEKIFVKSLERQGEKGLLFLFESWEVLTQKLSGLFYLEKGLTRLFTSKRSVERVILSFQSSLVLCRQEILQRREEKELCGQELVMFRHLDRIFQKPVNRVMTPLSRVIFLDPDVSVGEALHHATMYGYSRYPVLGADGKIMGVFRAKQLSLLRCPEEKIKNHLDDEFILDGRITCHEALTILQENKRHMAGVYSHSEFMGLVTTEDLVEELVGEIEDEFDQSLVKKLGRDVFLLDATVSLRSLEKDFSMNFGKCRAETLNGFLVEKLGMIPQRGTVLEWNKDRFVIEQADEKRIDKVKVYRG